MALKGRSDGLSFAGMVQEGGLQPAIARHTKGHVMAYQRPIDGHVTAIQRPNKGLKRPLDGLDMA